MYEIVCRASTVVVATLIGAWSLMLIADAVTSPPRFTPTLSISHFTWTWPGDTTWWWRGISIMCGLSGCIAAALFLTAAMHRGQPVRWHRLPGGGAAVGGEFQIRLSNRALLAIIARAAQEVEGVRQCEPEVRHRSRGWIVTTRVLLERGRSIPETSDAVTRSIQSALEQLTGVPLAKLAVDAGYENISNKRLA